MALTTSSGPLSPAEYSALYRAYEVRLSHGMPVANHVALLDEAVALVDAPPRPAPHTAPLPRAQAPVDEPDEQHARRALLEAALHAYQRDHRGEPRGRHHYDPTSQQRSRAGRAA